MIGFYGFNPAQNPLYANLLGGSTQSPLYSRLQGDNAFSNLQNTYSNVFNPQIIEAGLQAYNKGMTMFNPYDANAQTTAATPAPAQEASKNTGMPTIGQRYQYRNNAGELKDAYFGYGDPAFNYENIGSKTGAAGEMARNRYGTGDAGLASIKEAEDRFKEYQKRGLFVFGG